MVIAVTLSLPMKENVTAWSFLHVQAIFRWPRRTRRYSSRLEVFGRTKSRERIGHRCSAPLRDLAKAFVFYSDTKRSRESAQAGKRSGPRTVLRTRTTPNAHSVRLFQADQRGGLDTERVGGRRGRYWTVAADGRTRTRALQTLEESLRYPRPMGVRIEPNRYLVVEK